MNNVRWHEVADVAAAALTLVLTAAAAALAARGRFDIVLAGGSTPRELYRRLAALQPDMSAWYVWLGDERCLPESDSERNSRMILDAWPAIASLPAGHWHPMHAELGATPAAVDYAGQLARVGSFDLVLLGLGEDGHTASLFPGHAMDVAASPVLAVSGAPKPPAERVSLSASRLSDARQVLFLVAGAGKRNAIAAWREGQAIPAAAIRPVGGVDVLLNLD